MTRLPRDARMYWVVSGLVRMAVLGIGLAAAVWFLNWPRWLFVAPAIVVMLGLIDLAIVTLRYRNYGYRVDEREFFVARGRWVRRTVTIATPKILNVEVSQGPVQRLFNLAKVTVSQVVGTHDLGPVRPEEAERLRALLLDVAEREER